MAKQSIANNIINIMKQQGVTLSDDDISSISDCFTSTLPYEYLQMARYCKPAECEHSKICPLAKIGQAPEGYRCPIDIATIENLYDEIMVMLKENNVTYDFSIGIVVHDLVYNKLLLSRMEAIISDDGLFRETPIALDRNGELIEYVDSPSNAYVIRNQVIELTLKLYKILGIDRMSAVKIQQIKEDVEEKKKRRMAENDGSSKFNTHMDTLLSAYSLLDKLNMADQPKIVDAEVSKPKRKRKPKKKLK